MTHGLVDVLVVFDQDPLRPHVLFCPPVQRGEAESGSGQGRGGQQAGGHADQYAHVLENVGAERRVYFLPAAQVSRSFVEQVAVPRRQQVSHEYDGGADRDQDEQLAGPALVHVLGTLKERGWERGWNTLGKIQIIPSASHLDKPHRYEGHVVRAEHGADQHLLHPPVKVHLQVLHLFADEVRGEAAGVRGHGLDAVQLAGVLLPRLLQHRQVVPPAAHPTHLLGAEAGEGGEETRPAEVAAQPEKRNVHSKAAWEKIRISAHGAGVNVKPKDFSCGYLRVAEEEKAEDRIGPEEINEGAAEAPACQR